MIASLVILISKDKNVLEGMSSLPWVGGDADLVIMIKTCIRVKRKETYTT